MMRSPAQKFCAVDGGLGLFALGLETVEFRTVVVQLATELLDALVRLFLLGGNEFALGERVVVV